MKAKFKILLLIALAGGYFYAPMSLADSCIDMSGNVRYQVRSSQSVELSIGRIACRRDTGKDHTHINSGSLRVRLIATTLSSLPTGVIITPDAVLGTFDLEPLNGGQFFSDIRRTVNYSPPRDGTYYIYLIVEEFQRGCTEVTNQYCVVDSGSFGQQTFTSGTGGGGSGSGSGGSGSCVEMSGDVSYETKNNRQSVELSVERITCHRDRGSSRSGTVRVQLIATTLSSLPDDRRFSAHILAKTSLGQLNAGQSFVDIERTVDFTSPPPGTYYIYLVTEEFRGVGNCFSGTGYCLADNRRFSEQLTFDTSGSGSGTGGTGSGTGGGSGNSGGSSGGGCVYTPNTGVIDPVLPVLVLIALGYLLVRHRHD